MNVEDKKIIMSAVKLTTILEFVTVLLKTWGLVAFDMMVILFLVNVFPLLAVALIMKD